MTTTPQPVQPGVHTYQGSCHCGAIRFEVDVDLQKTTTQCNCGICTKLGAWGSVVRPEAFRLLTGELAPFGGPYSGSRTFCPRCGVFVYGQGNIEQLGGPFVSINVRCLDDVDLDGVEVRYLDGRHDTWAELAVRPWRDPFASGYAAD